MYQPFLESFSRFLLPVVTNSPAEMCQICLYASGLTPVFFVLPITPLVLVKGKLGQSKEVSESFSSAGDADLSPLFSKGAEVREVSTLFAQRLKDLLQMDSLSIYRLSESQERYQLFLSLGRPLPIRREISRVRFRELDKVAEPVMGSRAIHQIPANRLTESHKKSQSVPALFIPLEAEGKSYGFIVAFTRQSSLDKAVLRQGEWICQTLTAALVMEDFRQEISRLKQDYHRVEIEKGELTHRLQRKVFDLNSLFQVSNRLFALHDERGLVESLLEVVRDLLEARFTVFCGCYQGLDGRSSVLCGEGFGPFGSELLGLEVGSSFHSYLREHREPISLVALRTIRPEEEFLARLLELEFRAICGIYCADQLHGIVLCGPKLDGKEYDHGDMAELSILCNMTSVALQNLKQFRLIEELSYTDSMTGVYNYRYFYKRLTEEVTRAQRHHRRLSLVIFDLDEFKSYNDRFGHQIGDEILRQLASYTRKIVRSIDVVCRYGGEEFCVIMPDTDRQEVESFVERLREEIAGYNFGIGGLDSSPRVTASIGAAVFPEDADTVDRLIYCADMALLEAKKSGRNLAYLFSPQMAISNS